MEQPTPIAADPSPGWYVYLLRCADQSLYAGVTTDPLKRLRQHNGELVGGARYTRARRPVVLVWLEPAEDRPAALRRERELKALPARQKRALVSAGGAASLQGIDTSLTAGIS